MESHVQKAKASRAIANDARKTLVSLAGEIARVSSELGETLSNAPKSDASFSDWLKFFGESISKSRESAKVTTALSHRAACAVLLLARDAQYQERSKLVSEVKSLLSLGNSTTQQISALVNGYPMTARAVIEKGFPLQVYRRMSRVVNLWKSAFEKDQNLNLDELVKWVDEFVSTKNKAPTQTEIVQNMKLVFTISETSEMRAKSARESDSADTWSDRVAFGKAGVAEIPESIQSHAIELVQQKLKSKGIVTISQTSRLFPIWKATRRYNELEPHERDVLPGKAVVGQAIARAKEILNELEELQRQHALNEYNARKAELEHMANELGIDESAESAESAESWGDLDARVVTILESAEITPESASNMTKAELTKVNGIGAKSAERIITHFTN
jgi:hypothetical protein